MSEAGTITAVSQSSEKTQPIPPHQSETVHFEKDRGVTDVLIERGVAHVTVDLPAASLSRDRLILLQALADAGIPIFMIKLHPTGISFALREGVVDAGANLLRDRNVSHVLLRDLGQVAVFAGAMRDLSGVMALIYQALVSANILVRQTGDAYNAVLCLVEGAEVERAAHVLRECFFSRPEKAAAPGGSKLRGL